MYLSNLSFYFDTECKRRKFAYISPNLKYMSRIIYICFIVTTMFMSSACSDKKNYTIEAKIVNLEGKPIYVIQDKYNEGFKLDTLQPDNNFFRLKGSSNSLTSVRLYFNDKTELMSLYLKNGDHITLEGDANKPFEIAIKGNRINEEIGDFRKRNSLVLVRLREKEKNFVTHWNKPEYSQSIKQLRASLQKDAIAFIQEHKSSLSSSILIYEYLLDIDNYAFCDSLLKTLSPDAKPVNLQAKMEVIFSKILKSKIGTSLPYFTLRNENDSIIYSTSFNGKPTIITCWSIDDTLSMKEMRYQKNWYKELDRKDYNMVGISFDMDVNAWKNRLKTDSLSWKQVRLPEGWNSPWVKNSGIVQIPYTLVLDKRGKIIARNLQGSILQDYLIKMLEEEDSLKQQKDNRK